LSNYVVAHLFIRKIQDELPVFVETTKAMRLIHKNITDQDVLYLMNEAVDRSTARSKSMATVPKTDNKNLSRTEGTNTSALRNSPPKGKTEAEWVAEQLAKTTDDDTCAHCGWNHDTSKCYYLRPDLHRPHWKSRRGIWCYHGSPIKPKEKESKEENPKVNMAVTFDMNNDFACMALPAIAQPTAHVHIHKKDRVQAQKMAPRAITRHLIGYEGDDGRIYRIWDLRMTQSRYQNQYQTFLPTLP